MWKHLEIFQVLLITGSFIKNSFEDPNIYSKEDFDHLIQKVNSAGAHWTAGHNFDEKVNINHLLGTLPLSEDELENKRKNYIDFKNAKLGSHKPTTIPAFNGLEEWKHCPSVGYVWNQGQCASDWVIAPVSSITDRICIQSNGTKQDFLSPELPLSCCKTCGWGCKKGFPREVFRYWVNHGLVTGGGYRSEEGCLPYSIQPRRKIKTYYEHFRSGITPQCKNQCSNPLYKKSFAEDLNKGYDFYNQCTCCVGTEIMEGGPIISTLRVFEDFLTYKSGIYHHVYGKELGRLTVKVVGFNNTATPPYWIAVNSWGKNWGENGIFKIQKNIDSYFFEVQFLYGSLKKFNDEFYDENSSEER